MSSRQNNEKRASKVAVLAGPHHGRTPTPAGSDNANSGTPEPQVPRLQRIIRPADLPDFTGLSKSQIAVLIAEGKFPRPIKLSERAVGWLELELVDWQEQKRRERDGGRRA